MVGAQEDLKVLPTKGSLLRVYHVSKWVPRGAPFQRQEINQQRHTHMSPIISLSSADCLLYSGNCLQMENVDKPGLESQGSAAAREIPPPHPTVLARLGVVSGAEVLGIDKIQ